MDDGLLKVAYYGGLGLTILVAVGVALLLRRPFVAAIAQLPPEGLRGIFRRSLAPTLILTALAAFSSVSFRGCSSKTYGEIATDHALIAETAQSQASEVLSWLTVVLLAWGLVVTVSLIVFKHREKVGA